ncbi:MAG TPA: N-acetylglutaminylglutamine amidotransferase, partial [Gammaproteobacteria bacterium]|nr:N-acetylglutaminylglutamine amidotransferase [Gammaproteobacteria bacterium]
GYGFATTSDTEVLLKAYAAWGKDCVEHLNGMFAFAVIEHRTGLLFVARDRLGIKPFYYLSMPSAFRFASTLPALLAVHDGVAEIDPVALHHYMSFHSVVPAPRTILKGFCKLPPATRMTIHPDGNRVEERYWEPRYGGNGSGELSFEEAKDRVLGTLDRAVQRRMVADVPVGVLLSGGVDSSLVVGLLARNGAKNLKTFTVGFEDVGEEAGNEFEYSDAIAETFATEHHKFTVDSGELTKHLPACFRAMSEPMVSHDNIAFYLLSRKVAQHVKVVESGQGADEIFGGYFWYPPLMESRDPLDDYAAGFCDRDHAEMAEVLDSRWYGADHSREFLAAHFESAEAERAVDKALHIDTTVMLVDDPVKRVDNMTMAWGLEARVPFLDHELVELAAELPAEMKVVPEGKHVLKEAARDVIPSRVIDRPKGYFPVPALKYLNGKSLEFVQDAVNSRSARERGLFRRAYLDRLLEAPMAHLTPLRGSKLWQITALEVWLQTHNA